jgi:hypothetical protein
MDGTGGGGTGQRESCEGCGECGEEMGELPGWCTTFGAEREHGRSQRKTRFNTFK